jgi:hypothetical protein
VRFPNEAEALRARGGVLVEVRRPGVGPLSDHPSERLPAEPDRILLNHSTIDDLHIAIAALLQSVG